MAYIKADNPTQQKYFDFLEDLRQSGDTNMLGASPYLSSAFGLSKETAKSTLGAWMKAHDDPRRKHVSTDDLECWRFQGEGVITIIQNDLERQNAELRALLLKVATLLHYELIHSPGQPFNTCPDDLCTQARAAAQKE